jgi:hypothetical protein
MLVLTINDKDLRFEHSLVSLSEWEGFYEKPFFSDRETDEKTIDEFLKYFEFMLHPDDFKRRHLVSYMSEDQQMQMANYINSKRTATIVRELPDKPGPRENVTSELIYYWLASSKIPFTPTDTWHINRLFMLVKIMSIKNAPQTKQSKGQTIQDYRRINEENRRRLGTKG